MMTVADTILGPTPERMTAERVAVVLEQIARVIADFGGDSCGLHTIRVTLVRGNEHRCFIDYGPVEREGA